MRHCRCCCCKLLLQLLLSSCLNKMWVNVALTICCFIFFLYFYLTRNYGYFRSHGIAEIPSTFPFGAAECGKMFTGKISFQNFCHEMYKQYRQLPMVGYISFSNPVLVVNDLELAKLILIKDFDHFVNRRDIQVHEDVKANQYFLNMLLLMEGDKWKQMRKTVSPVFTSGKLKAMTKMINEVSEDFLADLTNKAHNQEEINAKDLMVNFMLDSFAKCGFGVEANSLTNPDSKFKAMVTKFLGLGRISPLKIINLMTIFFMPKVAKFLRLAFFEEESINFFTDVIRQSMKHRKATNICHNDFIDLTLDALKNEMKPEVEDDQFERDAVVKVSAGKKAETEAELELQLVSNMLLLIIGGVDATSTTIAICPYFLAKHQDIQERLFNEINDNLTEEDIKNLDYNTAHSLPYLDMFIHETLRMRPGPNGHAERRCSKPYKIPGTDFTIPEGMLVQIPTGAIMKDPQYFTDPETFNPENFSAENKSKRSPYTFLAFGQGPRNCIGMRFALMSIKICLIKLIKDFKVITCTKTPEKLAFDHDSRSGMPMGGVWFRVEKRNN